MTEGPSILWVWDDLNSIAIDDGYGSTYRSHIYYFNIPRFHDQHIRGFVLYDLDFGTEKSLDRMSSLHAVEFLCVSYCLLAQVKCSEVR
jgi:hypothetical protein